MSYTKLTTNLTESIHDNLNENWVKGLLDHDGINGELHGDQAVQIASNPSTENVRINALSSGPKSHTSVITSSFADNINAGVKNNLKTVFDNAQSELVNTGYYKRHERLPRNNEIEPGVGNNPLAQLAAGSSTGDYRIDALLQGSKWNKSTITFGFAAEIGVEIRNNVRAIFDTLTRIVNLNFVESTGAGDIHYSFRNDTKYAEAQYPKNGGDVFLNPEFDHANTSSGFRGGVGTHGFFSLLHETLHALGLKHPGNYSGDEAGDAPFLSYAEDNSGNTVMTYNFWGARSSTPMPYDILALQYLYGAKTYNQGNTTYIFDRENGFHDGNRYWGSATAGTKVTIWDSGGIDTLDFSALHDDFGSSYGSGGRYPFDLNPGGFLSNQFGFESTTYQAKDASLPGGQTTESYKTRNFGTAIAYGVTIENVIGTKFKDQIIGNQANNNLMGQNGNDRINGRLGDDTIYGGKDNDFLSSLHPFSPAIVGLSGEFTEQGGGWTSFNSYPRQLADVNGDGRADIVGFGQDTVYVSFGQANGTFSAPIVGLSGEFTPLGGGWTNFNTYPRQLADVNGDGRADIVGFGLDTVYVSLGQTNGTFSGFITGLSGEFTAQGGGWTSFDKYPRKLADVNGDGRADIVGFGQDTVYVSFGQAGGTFSAPIVGLSGDFTALAGGWTTFNSRPRQVADINGDGRADIVGFGNDTVFVAFGQANGTFGGFTDNLSGDFTERGSGWTNFDRYPRQVADINGDGRADIVGFGRDTVYIALAGGDGNDLLDGGEDNDTLEGGTGNNTLTGGLGSDVALYGRQSSDYQVSFTNNGEVQVSSVDGTDLLTGIEQINFDNAWYKVYTGDAGNNTLTATDPNSWSMMFGGNGNDSLKGGNGNDSLVGGLGNDTLMGLLGNDVLDGGEDNETLDGGEGNDTLLGGTGDDYLMGRSGADYMVGGIGNDKYVVDHVSDVVTEYVSEGTDTVISSIDYILGANVENLTLTDTAINGTGNGLSNYILGNAAGNYIFAEDGDDQVNGRGGDDYIHGGVGNDTLYGDTENDYLYGATGNDLFYGGDGNDTLLGDMGNDFFYGQAGDDLLIGGNGQDTLYGGIGADKFRFDLLSDGIDIIKDFNSTEGDRIEIFQSSFGATSLNQFSYNSNTGALFFDASPSDNIAPLQLATLANKPAGFSVQTNLFLV
jgi:FG-GAP-like repeat/RTX calcium-binding nonapeptide repeat (4 copies)